MERQISAISNKARDATNKLCSWSCLETWLPSANQFAPTLAASLEVRGSHVATAVTKNAIKFSGFKSNQIF